MSISVLLALGALVPTTYAVANATTSGMFTKVLGKGLSSVNIASAIINVAYSDGACMAKCVIQSAENRSTCFATQFEPSTSRCFMVIGCPIIALVNDTTNVTYVVSTLRYSIFP
jgi:hypothetical protein